MEEVYTINLNDYTILDHDPDPHEDICTRKVSNCNQLMVSLYRENINEVFSLLEDNMSTPLDIGYLNIMCQFYEYFGLEQVYEILHNLGIYLYETDINTKNTWGETALEIACLKYDVFGNKVIDKLLNHGANIQTTKESGENLLLSILEEDNIINKEELILKLIDLGVNVICQRESYLFNHETRNNWDIMMESFRYDWIPLMYICNYEKSDPNLEKIMTKMINNKDMCNFICKDGYYPIYLLCNNDNFTEELKLKLAKILLQNKCHPDRPNIYMSNKLPTPLMIAAMNKSYKLVKLLIDYGANPNCCNNYNMYPIDYALFPNIMDDQVYKIIKILIKNGSIINKNYSPLMRLAEKEYFDSKDDDKQDKYYKQCIPIAKLLINNNADLNLKNNQGNTALILSIVSANFELMEVLLENGADPNIQNNKGETTLTIGSNPVKHIEFDNIILKTPLYGYKTILSLIKSDADVNICDKNGENILMKTIVSLNCDENYIDEEFNDIYVKNCIKIINELIKNGIDLNQKDLYGQTAIMYLINSINLAHDSKEGYLIKSKILNILISAGGDINIENNKGQTIFQIVLNKIRSFQSILIKDLEIIIRSGAKFDIKDYEYSEFKILFKNIMRKIEIEKLKLKIKELEAENLHLKYSPEGYYIARDHFNSMVQEF